MTPQFVWDWDYLQFIQAKLNDVTTGKTKRLMLFVPPRHGKSEMTTVRYPVWRLFRDPEMRVVIGAYNQTLASKFARKSRRIATDYGLSLAQDRTAVEDWETTAGGGMRAVGVGGGITGQGGNLIVIDDPVKNREEANSEVYRNKVWDWYKDDLYTRQEPNCAIVLIMTRWHADDLAGRILESDDGPNWEVIKLPAEAEEDDQLGRDVGEALCSERYDVEALQRIKVVLGNSYYALYQQRPTSPEGEMFKRQWFEIVPGVPRGGQLVRYWDKAGTAGGGAETAGVLMGVVNGTYYVIDVVHGHWAAAEREQVIKQTAQIDGPNVRIFIEQEPGSGGKESAEATIRNLPGWTVKADRPTGDKVLRAEPFAAQCQIGAVKIVRAAWNNSYLDELTSFPHGRLKDMVDGSSGAFSKLVEPNTMRITKYAS